jgi:hypothetical protein
MTESSSAAARPWGMDFIRRLFSQRTDPITGLTDIENAPEVLRRDNFALVRGIVPAPERQRLYEFADGRLVAPGDPGNNLMLYISNETSVGFETTFWLIRSVINRRVAAIASAYFQAVAGTRDFLLPLNNLLIRQFDATQSKPDLLVPYHQDGAGLPKGFHMINCWTLIYPDECGATSPGLDFCPAPVHDRLATEAQPKSKIYGSLESDYDKLAALMRRYGSITPSVALGDILMFNELALHRTSIARPPTMTKSRVSAEIRLVAANASALKERDRTGAAYALVSGSRIEWPSVWQRRDGFLVPIKMDSADLTDLAAIF